MTEITTAIERLTPADANRLLDRNTHNRPLREADVLKWATEMEAGEWQLNGEAIKIATNGDLLDGQHRLRALALQEEGFATDFVVVRGLSPETQKTMDQGRKRSLADQLNLNGVAANNTIAGAIRIYLVWHRGLLFRDNKVVSAKITTPVMVEWAQQNPEKVELLNNGYQFRKIKARPAIVVAMYGILSEIHDIDMTNEFFGRTLDGVGLELGSPILALRNRLDSVNGDLVRTSKQRISDRDLMASIIVAFNAWATGRSLGRIQRPAGAAWTADNFPRIITPKGVKMGRTKVQQGAAMRSVG